eukprot:g3092.t1
MARLMEEEDPLVGQTRYETKKLLAKGAYGYVVLAKDTSNNEDVAIKLLPRGPRINKYVEREVLNHRKLLHHHVIKFKGVFLTRRCIAIVMEYVSGGSLLEYMNKHGQLAEDVVRWIFQQLIFGLDYIHRMGIANRDIKPSNTLLDNSNWPIIKICDFGFSKHEFNDSSPSSVVGTIKYLAPEVFFVNIANGEKYDGKKADIWSCGALLYLMIMGHHLYEVPGKTTVEHEANINETLAALDSHVQKGKLSSDCADMIRKILTVDPEKRAGINEIQAHIWYKKSLPSGALSFNKLTEEQKTDQTEEEIKQLFREAKEKS